MSTKSRQNHNAAIRHSQFKLVRLHGREWELYDMEVDRTELNSLIHGESERVREMTRQYSNWAKKVGVSDWDILLPRLLAAWNMESVTG